MKKQKSSKVYVIVKCISCGASKKIFAGDIDSHDIPMCEACYLPMVAVSAKTGD